MRATKQVAVITGMMILTLCVFDSAALAYRRSHHYSHRSYRSGRGSATASAYAAMMRAAAIRAAAVRAAQAQVSRAKPRYDPRGPYCSENSAFRRN